MAPTTASSRTSANSLPVATDGMQSKKSLKRKSHQLIENGDGASADTLSKKDKHDLEAAGDRLVRAMPPQPYILTVPMDHEYHVDPRHRFNWMVGDLFEPEEEALQYQSFLGQTYAYDTIIQFKTHDEVEADLQRKRRKLAPMSDSGANDSLRTQIHRKKISLAAYKHRSKTNSNISTPIPQAATTDHEELSPPTKLDNEVEKQLEAVGGTISQPDSVVETIDESLDNSVPDLVEQARIGDVNMASMEENSSHKAIDPKKSLPNTNNEYHDNPTDGNVAASNKNKEPLNEAFKGQDDAKSDLPPWIPGINLRSLEEIKESRASVERSGSPAPVKVSLDLRSRRSSSPRKDVATPETPKHQRKKRPSPSESPDASNKRVKVTPGKTSFFKSFQTGSKAKLQKDDQQHEEKSFSTTRSAKSKELSEAVQGDSESKINSESGLAANGSMKRGQSARRGQGNEDEPKAELGQTGPGGSSGSPGLNIKGTPPAEAKSHRGGRGNEGDSSRAYADSPLKTNIKIPKRADISDQTKSTAHEASSKKGDDDSSWRRQVVRYRKLGKSLKEEANSNLGRAGKMSTDTELVHGRLGLVQATESILAFMQAFYIFAENGTKRKEALENWESLLVFASNYSEAVQAFEHLRGLFYLLRWAVCCNVSYNMMLLDNDGDDHASTHEERLFTRLRRNNELLHRFGTASDDLLSRKVLKQDYPLAEAELDNVPLVMNHATTLSIIKLGVRLLEEWTAKHKVEWNPQMEL